MITDLEKAAIARALEILGEEQFNNPDHQVAKDGIADDFKAGVEWLQQCQLESRADENFKVVSRFQEYINENFDIRIPDELVESFFEA